ncbi:MAG: MBL fold metallo-hydrolase [Marinomonas sp.]|nr:MAG: MBL fold metallo-hydrolase [Marinomonas sp.]
MIKQLSQCTLLSLGLVALPVLAKTQVVTLGTGTPVTNPERVGSATAVVYNDKAYLFDIGPGAVHRTIQAAANGFPQLHPTKIENLFITHLHSDHILDYGELASTLWWRRDNQISVFGPKGIQAMTNGYYDMLQVDLDLRLHGLQPVKNPELYKTKVTEYEHGGWVFKDGDVTIEAFDVPHGDIEPAFGYKITTPDKSIVISGDTGYSEKLIEMAKGVDILVHEVINDEALKKVSPAWQNYHSQAHTPAAELAKVANAVQPGLLVLTHLLFYAEPVESTAEQVRQHYDGKVVLANDLDVFE